MHLKSIELNGYKTFASKTTFAFADHITAIVGPNGSGKTTTLGMLLGIIVPDEGTFSWFNNGDPYIRRKIGSILETPNFYPYLNALDNLRIVSHIKKSDQQDFQEVLTLVGLWDRRKSLFSQYSLGMKQRLAIAATLIGDPEVLIFDEPTNGLDPQGIADVRDIILRIADTGKTILMASHILIEVEKICSHVGILKNGRLLAKGPVGAILSHDQYIEIGSPALDSLAAFLEKIPGIHDIKRQNDHFTALVSSESNAADINKKAFEAGITLNRLVIRQKSLESEFLEIVKDQ